MGIETLSAIAGILSALLAFFNFVIIKPLRNAIDKLEIAIESLHRESQERLSVLHTQDVRLSVLEEHSRRLDEEIDELKRK